MIYLRLDNLSKRIGIYLMSKDATKINCAAKDNLCRTI